MIQIPAKQSKKVFWLGNFCACQPMYCTHLAALLAFSASGLSVTLKQLLKIQFDLAYLSIFYIYSSFNTGYLYYASLQKFDGDHCVQIF